MIDRKKYRLAVLFKLAPLGKELGFTPPKQLRIDSIHHDELLKALHYAVKNVIKDFGGLEYEKKNAEAKEIKQGPKNSGTRYLESK